MPKPKIHLIAAQTLNRVIGKDGGMPWHLPRDLQHFKQRTSGHTIIMGRKTFQSLKKPLPNRKNIVISRSGQPLHADVAVFPAISEALAFCCNDEKVFIIGGGSLYAATIDEADFLTITWIHTELLGDTFFPPIRPQDWQETHRSHFAADAKNAFALDFVDYQRR